MSNTQYSEHTQSPQPGVPAPASPKGSNGMAVAGFVLGILGFLGAFIPVLNIGAIVLAVIGAALAAVGLARSKSVRGGKGLAIAGLVLSVLAVVIAIIIDVAVGSAVNNAVKDATSTTVNAPASAGSKGTSGDSNVGTTRANPAPIGTSITGGGWTVKVNSVKTASQDSMGQQPGTGKILLVVNMTARYTGHDQQGDSSLSTVDYVAPNGRTYDGTEGNKPFIPNHQFDLMKTLYHGASETGNEMIEIPANNWQHGVLSVSPSMLSDHTFVAVK